MAVVVLLIMATPETAGVLGRFLDAVAAGDSYVNLLTLAGATPSEPELISVFIFAAAPTIAALWLASMGVRTTVPKLLRRLNPVGPNGTLRRSLVLYGCLLGVYFFGLFLFDWVAGPGINAYERLSGFGAPIIIGALMGLFLDEGGTLEELGWRGFAWPALLSAMKTPLGAALVMGVIHWAWHLPRDILPLMGGAEIAPYLLGQLTFLLLTIALAIVCGYCVNVTGGSVIPAIMIHGGTNVWSKAMGDFVNPVFFDRIDLRSFILIIIAIIILIFARRRLGLKDT